MTSLPKPWYRWGKNIWRVRVTEHSSSWHSFHLKRANVSFVKHGFLYSNDTDGVKPDMFPHMVDSMVSMLKTKLGKNFTSAEENAWVEVFAVLIEDIIAAQDALSIEEAAQNKATVEQTWKKFTKIPNYEEVGGVVLFSQ